MVPIMLSVILLFLASLTASLIAIYVIITIGYGFKEAVLESDPFDLKILQVHSWLNYLNKF